VRKIICVCIALLVSSCLGIAAQGVPQKANPKDAASQGSSLSEAKPSIASDDFIIGLQDVLSINVWKEPDLSVREIVVRPDGKVSLPLVNDIQASGLTTKQLQEQIAKKLTEYVATPVVTVTVVRIMSRSVSVVGEVRNPGIYPFGSPMTVLEALAKAGGFSELAKTKKIRIIRKESKNTLEFNYKDVASGKKLQQNVVLENGDVVIVP
jgi:polysaccharide biosynthesis/export protein